MVDEYFPAGATLVEGSVEDGSHHYEYEVGDGVIRFYYPPGKYLHDYRYQLVSYAPGNYRVAPTVIRDPMYPGDMRIGNRASLTVLAPGEKSTDLYKMNDGERYALGKAYFDDGRYSDALSLLEEFTRTTPITMRKRLRGCCCGYIPRKHTTTPGKWSRLLRSYVSDTPNSISPSTRFVLLGPPIETSRSLNGLPLFIRRQLTLASPTIPM